MFVDVTSWPNETLADLREAGLLFFAHEGRKKPILIDDAGVKWNNTPWAYEQRRHSNLCTLHLQIE